MNRKLDNDASLDVASLDYALPDVLIAQFPPVRRDDARLLVVDRAGDTLGDRRVKELPDLLRLDDLLVLNDTKVVPAKLVARRETGGRVGGLFLRERSPGVWEVLLEGSKRLRVGEILTAGDDTDGEIGLRLEEDKGEGRWVVRVDRVGSAESLLERIGVTPLPPYIRRRNDDRSEDDADRRRYQTVYARNAGAIAAPTAGLHFTPEMLNRIRGRGIRTAFVTLHVGIGTFRPLSVDRLDDHVMHSELFELSSDTAEAITACRARGGRVVAVGTTTVRVLESSVDEDGSIVPAGGSTDIFIRPPHRFRVVDALLTNFHLPRSTLLALVMAFAGVSRTRDAYAHAVEKRYRFYSYGDAMLID